MDNMETYIKEIADLIVEYSKERKDIASPTRAIYSVFREVAGEIGRRMDECEKIQREEKHERSQTA